MKQSLYELTNEVLAVKDMFEADFIDEETLHDTLEGLDGSLEKKSEGLLAYVANLKAEEQAIGDEIKRLQKRKKEKANHQQRLRDYLRDNMMRGGIQKITCPLFQITLCEPRDVVAILDLEQVPDVYTTATIKPDKALIKQIGRASGRERGQT